MFKKVFYILLIFFTLYMAGIYWSRALIIVGIVEIIIFVLLFVLSYRVSRMIHIEMQSPNAFVRKGDNIKGCFVVDNTSILPVNAFAITVTYIDTYTNQMKTVVINGAIEGKKKTEIPFSISTEYCGDISIQVQEISVYDYLLVFERKRKLNLQSKIIILPCGYSIPINISSSFFKNITYTEDDKTMPSKEVVSDFNIREYIQGDSIRHIHWKLHARTEQLWTKDYDGEEPYILPLFLDLYKEKEMSLLQWDAFYEVVASISSSLLKKGIIHSITFYEIATGVKRNHVIKTQEDYTTMLIQLILTKRDIMDRKDRSEEKVLNTYDKALVIDTSLQVMYQQIVYCIFTKENYKEELEEAWITI